MQLDSKTVVVTGGARGLGRAYCESLAAEGANVVAADIRDTKATVDSVKSTGGSAIGVDLDVADMSSCEAMAQAAIDSFGRVDALVNNAALYGDISGGRCDQIPDDQWDKVMKLNSEDFNSGNILTITLHRHNHVDSRFTHFQHFLLYILSLIHI